MGRPSKKDAVEKYHCRDGQNLKDLIISLYHGKGMSLSEVAEKLHVPANPKTGEEEINLGKTTIFHWMEYFNIPSRDETPAAVKNTISKTVAQDPYKADNSLPANFDPHIDGFVCQMQCPYFEICKYREHYIDKLCPVSSNKRKKVLDPIKSFLLDNNHISGTLFKPL